MRLLVACCAIGLIAILSALTVGSFARHALLQKQRRGDRPDVTSQIIRAFAAIDAKVGTEPLGFWLAQPLHATTDPSLSGMYYMAQRAVAPRVLQPETDQRWVLLIGVDQQSLPTLLAQRRARLVQFVPPNTAFVERLP